MEQNNIDKLRQMLSEKAKAAVDKSISKDGKLAADEIDSLEQLSRLVKLVESSQTKRRPNLWLLPALFLTTLIILSILLFGHVSETEIELDVTASDVSFAVPDQQVLTTLMQLTRLGIDGLNQIRIPRSQEEDSHTISSADNGRGILHVLITPEKKETGSLSLSSVIVPVGTRVRIYPTEIANQYGLSLTGSSVDLRAEIFGRIQMSFSDHRSMTYNFASPKAIVMTSDSQEVRLVFSVANDSIGAAFSSQLAADELRLFQIDEFVDQKNTIVRKVSTIHSGTLYLEELKGKEIQLRPREQISFKQSVGEIRTIQLNDNRVGLKYYGRVRGMDSGFGENKRNLMPTYLEWLSARHGLSLLWGATLYIFGIIVGVLRWLEKV
jgi:hypothetical protein